MKKYTFFLLLPLTCTVMQSQAQWANQGSSTNAGGLVTDINGQGHNTATGTYSTAGSTGMLSSYGVFHHLGQSGTGTAAAFINDGMYDASVNGQDYFKGPNGATGQQEIAGSAMTLFGELFLQNGTTSQFNITSSNGIWVAKALSFDNGITTTIRSNTSTGAIMIDDDATYTASNLGDGQHVNGYVSKTGNDVFTFPVGSGTDLRTLTISAPAITNDAYSVAWMAGDPTTTADPSDAGATHSIAAVTAPITSVSPRGQWDWIVLNGIGAGLNITVSIPDLSVTGVQASDLRLVGWDGSSWIDLSGSATASGNIEDATLSGIMQSGITAIGIGTIGGVTLPVTFVSFAAEANGCSVSLAWVAASEDNNAYFGVERSTSSKSWEVIGEVPVSGKGGEGKRRYSFMDTDAPAGDLFYRLRQTDLDGSTTYSRIAAVHTNCGSMVQVYPNPTHDYITVKGVAEGNQLQLVNTLGRVVLEQTASTTDTKVSLTGMAYGLYWLRVLEDDAVIGQYKIVYAQK